MLTDDAALFHRKRMINEFAEQAIESAHTNPSRNRRGMSGYTDPVIDAIVVEVRQQLPPLDQVADIPDDGTMGPSVTIPAVWMQLLLLRMQVLDTQISKLELDQDGALRRRNQPLAQSELDIYAGELSSHAVSACGDPLRAASVMIQGAVTLMTATLPEAVVVDALNNIVDAFDLRAILGIEGTKA